MIRKSLWKIGINEKYLLMPTIFRSLSSFSTHEFYDFRIYIVRKCFINYFEKHNHIHVPSSSVLPDSSDDTLMFTNAGMNQFKSIFLGSMDNRWSHLQRVVNYQKCIRAGGKHNDLDDVGRDLYHQTFFEMLGSWSFNDGYSREMACHLAWNFLTEVLNIDSSRLYVSYFGGNEMLGIPADIKCKKIWLNLGIPESHIIPFDKDNFWEMGSVGPCGPSTEIHYDRKQGRKNAQHLVNVDVSLVELWNIVFMSYMRLPNGQLKILPKEHIDTGMGLERLVSVVQNVPSNFDIDIFVPILNRICELSSGSAYTGLVADEDINMKDTAYRIVADHIRAVTIALSDGALPGPSKIGLSIF
uniref:alanine--tRNA ligase n=1 Tax=Heterorhabditis bacteriophora TaxID=37862 RepID=A0A1I7WWA6_HETBA